MATILVGACAYSYGPGWEFLDEDLDQNIRAPLIRGTAYDAANERVFFSSCRPQEFACDLLVVSSDQAGPAGVFRASTEYGYTWPAVSPDGAHLAAVRTPRHWRPNQRQVQQELVEIDMATGEERVVAASDGVRFDRVLYVPSGLVVVRTIRSSPSVPCHAYFCGDWGDLVIFRGGAPERLPIDARSDSGIVGSGIHLVPLADGRLYIRAAQRTPSSDVHTSIVLTWMMEADGSLGGPATRIAETEALIANVPLGGWRSNELIGGRVGRIESTPFNGTTGDALALTNTNMSGPTRAAFVRKVRDGGGFTLHVEALDRGEDGAWRSHWTADVAFPR